MFLSFVSQRPLGYFFPGGGCVCGGAIGGNSVHYVAKYLNAIVFGKDQPVGKKSVSFQETDHYFMPPNIASCLLTNSS